MLRRAPIPLLLLLLVAVTPVRSGPVLPDPLPEGQRVLVSARFTAGRETVSMEGRILFSGVREIYLASADVVALLRLGRYWDPDRRQLTLRGQGPVCELTAGSRLVRIDGRDHLLALPPVARDGDLWLPMECMTRLLAPALDEPLTWDADALTLRFGGPRRNVLDARIDTGARSTTLRLRCGEPLSFRAVSAASDRILLRVFGGVIDGQVLRRTAARGLIRSLDARQSDEFAEIAVDLGPLAGGFDAHAEDGGRIIVLTIEESPTGALPDPTIRGGLGMSAPVTAGDRPLGRVVIDPGHGGLDEGRRSPQGRLEKDVVLRLARDVRDALRDRGFETLLTRDGDEGRDQDARCAQANSFGGDLFLSLHADGWFNARARGLTLYVQRAGGGDAGGGGPLAFVPWETVQQRHAGAANEFALDLQGRLAAADILPVRGLVAGDFPLLRSLDMPALLIEAGFLTNANDAGVLDDDGARRRLAAVLADAVAGLRDRRQAAAVNAGSGGEGGGR